MFQELESKIENRVFVLDTSVVTPSCADSINQILYHGWEGLDKIPEGLTDNCIKRLEDIEDMANTCKLLVPREVRDEINADQEILARHLAYFRSDRERRYEQPPYDTLLKQLSEYNFQKIKLVKKLSKKDFRIGFTDELDHANDINFILEKSKSRFISGQLFRYPHLKDHFKRFIAGKEELALAKPEDYSGPLRVDFNLYKPLLEVALARSRNSKVKSILNASHKKSPGCYGLALDTDSKIAALGVALSFDSDITFLTRDSGLKDLIMVRMLDTICTSYKNLSYHAKTFQLQKISFFNPDGQEKENSPRLECPTENYR